MRGSPFAFSNFSMGLNALDSPYELKTGEARDVLNMQSTLRGAIRKRTGSTQFAGGAVSPLPALAVADNFNRAALGANWSAMTGAVNVGTISEETHWQASGEPSGARWNVAEQTNPAASIELTAAPSTGATLELFVCMNAISSTGYCLIVEHSSGVLKLQLGQIVKGSFLTLGFLTPQVNLPWTSGVSVGITARGSTLTAWHRSPGVGQPWLAAVETTIVGMKTKGYTGISTNSSAWHVDNFTSGETPAPVELERCTSIGQANINGTRYLLVTAGTNLYSITTAGSIAIIKEGLTPNTRWSILQATSGAPNRVVADGPIYLSNGVDPPLYWTGATATTIAAEWTGKPEGEFLAVPKAKYLLYHNQRIWAAGIEGSDSAVRFSGLSEKAGEGFQVDPTNWPKENLMLFEQADGNAITGLSTSGIYVLVFKAHKLWAIFSTATEEGEGVRQVSENVGCVSHRSIVETENGTFFLTPDKGVFVTNGLSIREVSQQIRPILQGTDYLESRAARVSELSTAAAGYLNGHYYLSYTAQDGSRKTLDYDVLLKSWWLHDIAGEQWIVWGTSENESSLFTIPAEVKKGVYRTFVPGVYTDGGALYKGGRGRSVFPSTFGAGSTEIRTPWEESLGTAAGQYIEGPNIEVGTQIVSVTKVRISGNLEAQIIINKPTLGAEEAATLTIGKLTCYWVSSWEPFWQYFMRHRFQQPQVKKRVHQLFADGRGELSTFLFTSFAEEAIALKGTVDNNDMAKPEGVLTLSDDTEEPKPEYKAARYYSLGAHRVFSVMFGNNSTHRLEVTAYAMDITFRKS